MFLARPDVALARLAASIVPGGRLVAAVWGRAEANPSITLPVRVLTEFLELPPSPADAPGLFDLGGPGRLADLFERVPLDDAVRPGPSLSHSTASGSPRRSCWRRTDVKTTNGRRTIDINDDVARALQTCWRRQAEERLLVGPGYQDDDLVFARPDGRPTHPELLSRTFDRVVVRNGLPRIRFHDLRHTHASLLLKAGVPIKVVSEQLGHASASFTLDVYGWVLPGMHAEAAAVFSRLMSAHPVEDSVEVTPPASAAEPGLAL